MISSLNSLDSLAFWFNCWTKFIFHLYFIELCLKLLSARTQLRVSCVTIDTSTTSVTGCHNNRSNRPQRCHSNMKQFDALRPHSPGCAANWLKLSSLCLISTGWFWLAYSKFILLSYKLCAIKAGLSCFGAVGCTCYGAPFPLVPSV